MTRAILPCAGLGSRMNMAPDKSKEMLIDTKINAPIIDWSLDLCTAHNLDPLIITRKEKTDLIEYAATKNIETLIITPQGEWPTTILQAKHMWHNNNILILPDGRFEPQSIVADIDTSLQMGSGISLGVHYVQDKTKWCTLENHCLIEKPQENGAAYAFGVLGWKKENEHIFDYLERRAPCRLVDYNYLFLDYFVDITRNGVVDLY